MILTNVKTFIIDTNLNNLELETKIFFDKSWGNCQFYRIKIPSSIEHLSGNIKIVYKNFNENVTIYNIACFIFEKDNFCYYDFFIPHFLKWDTKTISIEIELLKNQEYFAKINGEIQVDPREWKKQTIFFKNQKSNQLINTNKSNYQEESKLRHKIWQENNPTIYFQSGYNLPLDNDKYIISDSQENGN